MNKDKQYLMVYGTLKVGHGNHRWMEGLNPIGEATAKGVSIVCDGGLPYAVVDEEGLAHGELYETDMEHVERVDRLEGHPTFYRRYLSEVECNGLKYTAWIYFCNEMKGLPIVKGQWE